MSKVAFVFPGQGAQYVGMGQELAAAHPSFFRAFEEASEALGYNLAQLCFAGPEEKLKETAHTQPAILTMSVACLRLLSEVEIAAEQMAGLSLGEYAALVGVGSLPFARAVKLVQQRGIYMQEAVPIGQGAMAAILGLSPKQVDEICGQAADAGVVAPANYNCPGQIVIAGQAPAVHKAMALCETRGASKTILLPVSAPFHCSLMTPAAERLAVDLAAVPIQDAQLPVVANVTAQPVTSADEIRDLLIRQVFSPVRWEESVRTMLAAGVDTFLEIGPGRALSGFIRRVDRKARVFNIEDSQSLTKVLDSFGRVC